jgi:Family of unknown function (DUF6267)
MQSFKIFLKEEAGADDGKLKHIHHAEDRPLFHGSKGFEHAKGALNQAHEHMKSGSKSTHLTMKYDGSPSLVFGHHPETGKFFVASKSAFNKNPKINYTHEDIKKNHGHAPGLMDKLHASLNHLKKIAPKTGVYQGDLMYTHDDLKHHKNGKVSFTPNTITYTGHGEEGQKIKNSKIGVVVHTQYHGDTAATMKADPHPDLHNFKTHPDVWTKHPEHDTSNIHYSENDQTEFRKHMSAAQKIHDTHKKTMYKNTMPHAGEAGHLATYINQTVRTDEKPSAEGLKQHISDKINKSAEKLKTPASKGRRQAELNSHIKHIDTHKKDYENLLKMHQHLQKAKDVLVHNLNQHTGGLEHHIDSKATDPEGYVVHHAGEPTKLVNRKEFAKANLLKVRK